MEKKRERLNVDNIVVHSEVEKYIRDIMKYIFIVYYISIQLLNR